MGLYIVLERRGKKATDQTPKSTIVKKYAVYYSFSVEVEGVTPQEALAKADAIASSSFVEQSVLEKMDVEVAQHPNKKGKMDI